MATALTTQELEKFEPTAKILAANGIAQSLSFTSERKYLNGISASSTPMCLELLSNRKDLPSAPYWIKISQVGKPIDDSAEKCFTSIQRFLRLASSRQKYNSFSLFMERMEYMRCIWDCVLL